ncbi:porin [Bordetella genomosp. 9]|uniref:Porin n=1 Tax=Bordetella genomosp. 9 TaxID=1416803 RepID=A0A1W6Z5X0_9BORD|nr:porin [Bordetella genomosp. 9]ARP88651.1 porin [Bordetella genomosp. 9]
MRKTVILAAMAAGFTAAAHAETSVTLYGVLDAGVGYERIHGDGFSASKVGMVQGTQNGSRFGIRGVEDLGGGLSAVFNLENGFGPKNGQTLQGGRLWGRQATVGLNSVDWGRLEFGRQTNMASKLFGTIDPFALSFNVANQGTTFGAMNTLRLDNMVLYQTPTISGFKFGLGYSFNADDGRTNNDGQVTGFETADNNRQITAGLSYTNGPLYLAASYDRVNPTDAAVGGQSSAKLQEWALGGTYDFEVVKIAAAVGQTYDGWFLGQGLNMSPGGDYADLGTYKLRDGFRATSTMLGFTVPTSGSTAVFGSWQRAAPNNGSLTGDDKTFNVYSLGATYAFTKRTNLYVYASYGDNYAFHDGVTDTAVAAGIRHRF